MLGPGSHRRRDDIETCDRDRSRTAERDFAGYRNIVDERATSDNDALRLDVLDARSPAAVVGGKEPFRKPYMLCGRSRRVHAVSARCPRDREYSRLVLCAVDCADFSCATVAAGFPGVVLPVEHRVRSVLPARRDVVGPAVSGDYRLWSTRPDTDRRQGELDRPQAALLHRGRTRSSCSTAVSEPPNRTICRDPACGYSSHCPDRNLPLR